MYNYFNTLEIVVIYVNLHEMFYLKVETIFIYKHVTGKKLACVTTDMLQQEILEKNLITNHFY